MARPIHSEIIVKNGVKIVNVLNDKSRIVTSIFDEDMVEDFGYEKDGVYVKLGTGRVSDIEIFYKRTVSYGKNDKVDHLPSNTELRKFCIDQSEEKKSVLFDLSKGYKLVPKITLEDGQAIVESKTSPIVKIRFEVEMSDGDTNEFELEPYQKYEFSILGNTVEPFVGQVIGFSYNGIKGMDASFNGVAVRVEGVTKTIPLLAIYDAVSVKDEP